MDGGSSFMEPRITEWRALFSLGSKGRLPAYWSCVYADAVIKLLLKLTMNPYNTKIRAPQRCFNCVNMLSDGPRA
eukprot:12748884-Heterocapsa_arctica.AAC.1